MTAYISIGIAFAMAVTGYLSYKLGCLAENHRLRGVVDAMIAESEKVVRIEQVLPRERMH